MNANDFGEGRQIIMSDRFARAQSVKVVDRASEYYGREGLVMDDVPVSQPPPANFQVMLYANGAMGDTIAFQFGQLWPVR